MPIAVTCPGCLSRFTVSDKYAGKKGPCPKCKKELIVPDKSQEVVIHAPEPTGPKDSKGVAVLKPIRRIEFKPSTTQLIIASSIALVSLILAIVGRFAFAPVPWWGLATVIVALSYPIAIAGYTFFRDDELGGYTGRELQSRMAACAAAFAATWGLYWFVSYYLGSKTLADVDGIQFAISIGVMFVIGTLASLLACELEIGQSVLHYSMFFGVTFVLALVAGVEMAEPLSSAKAKNPYGLPNMPKPSAVAPPNTAAPANTEPAKTE